VSFGDLSCGPKLNHPCDLWEHQFKELQYGYNRARTSTFDPIIDLTSDMPSLSSFADRRAVRVVTIMTDGCARESGRSTDNEQDRARIWNIVCLNSPPLDINYSIMMVLSWNLIVISEIILPLKKWLKS